MPLSRKISLVLLLTLTACNPGPNKPNFGPKSGIDETPQKPPGDGKVMVDHVGAMERPRDPVETKQTIDTIFNGEMDSSCDGQAMLGQQSLRLLTADEFYNSLRDILKIKSDFRGNLPPENKVNGFRNNIDKGRVSVDHETAYLDIAINAADEAKASLQGIAGCTEDAGEACAKTVIEKIGPKIYRRPLTEAEKTANLNVYKKGLATSPREGMTMLLSHMILSPAFLYRSEIGESGQLTPYELASALSFFFWGTSPDDALVSLAASGKLSEEATLLAQAERLWNDPKSKYVTSEFARGWMNSQGIRGNNKDAKYAAMWTQPIKDAMAAEMDDTFDHLMKKQGGSFELLFTADYSIGSPMLAQYYKGQAMMEEGVSKIKVPGAARKGLLSLGAVTANLTTSLETHPIKRGEFVLSHALCFVPPPTPAGLEVKIPEQNPNATTRERFAKHSSNPACASCHIRIDGVGFGMEDFDSLGQFRSMDNGKAVDASGTLVAVDNMNTTFSGVADMSAKLAASNEAKRCFALQWFRFAHGRQEEKKDICSVKDIAAKFSKGEISLSALLVKIITHPAYLKRGQ